MRVVFALLSGAAFAARVKPYTPPGVRSFSPSAPITNPEEFVNTLGGTKAIVSLAHAPAKNKRAPETEPTNTHPNSQP